jgi:DNA-binding CsgD family transcriptional regulator
VSRKLDEATAERIIRLHFEQGLPASVIIQRLGISERTVWNYIKAFRKGQILSCITLKSVESGLTVS